MHLEEQSRTETRFGVQKRTGNSTHSVIVDESYGKLYVKFSGRNSYKVSLDKHLAASSKKYHKVRWDFGENLPTSTVSVYRYAHVLLTKTNVPWEKDREKGTKAER